MLTILVLLVGLTLATAVIAYWSDNLGKKLGKKRVSLWGMRPRTTATFLTIASSWLIMLFTLGAMLAVFSPLRQALLRFDEVKAQEQELRASKKQLDAQVGSLQQQVGLLETNSASARQLLDKANRDLQQSRQSARRAREERKQAVAEAGKAQKKAQGAAKRAQVAARDVQKARANLSDVKGQLRATKAQRAAAQRQYDQAQRELNAANAELNRANQAVQAAQSKVEAANAKVEKANAQLGQVQTQLSKVQSSLATAQQDVTVARANAEKAREQAEVARVAAQNAGRQAVESSREAAIAQREVREAQESLEQLEQEGRALRLANEKLRVVSGSILAESRAILNSEIRVAAGRTIAARSFEARKPEAQARAELMSLFERAATEVVPTLLPGAELQLEPIRLGSDETGQIVLDPEQIYLQLAQNVISRSQTPVLVRLVATTNHLKGEPVLYSRFVVVPIRPALPGDFQLASAQLDGSQSEANLFSALLDLADEGRDTAARNGVEPPSPEAPVVYAPNSRELIFEALRAVKTINGPARVRILTEKPISTVDQLLVRFDVQAAPATPSATPARAQSASVPAT